MPNVPRKRKHAKFENQLHRQVAQQLAELVAVRGLSLRQLAGEIGIGKSSLHRALDPEGPDIPLATVITIARHLGYDVAISFVGGGK